MILVDTSIIVALLDAAHEHHGPCSEALNYWRTQDELAVSSVTCAELAAGGRTLEAINHDLSDFYQVDLDWQAAFRAGQAFGRFHPAKRDKPVLPDFLIRAQAAVFGWPHLTNDHRRLRVFPEVEFLFPG
jgi:predicted nucleic acid-binding protein